MIPLSFLVLLAWMVVGGLAFIWLYRAVVKGWLK